MTISAFLIGGSSALPGWWPKRGEWLLLAGYGFAFAFAIWVAAAWGGAGYYSVWFPAAGLRLALLWRMGARLTPAVALVEVLSDYMTGGVPLDSPDLAATVFAIVRPVIAYGIAVVAIRRLAERVGGSGLTAPMPFGLAAVAAPLLAALVALPQSLMRPDMTHIHGTEEAMVSLVAFTVGDMLGILTVAPVLLWLADIWERRTTLSDAIPPAAALVEAIAVLTTAMGMTWGLERSGLGLSPAPVLLATTWIGLRFGRGLAWCVIMVVIAAALPYTAALMSTPERVGLHLDLTTLVLVGYLAGSFSDAQVRARMAVERRDRLLFQAERLKTLRAMSVAVIHEISQPLSTLAIEARHLNAITADAGPEVAEGAALIHRKAETLSTLVRRLRRFGGRAADEPTPTPLAGLLDTSVALVLPEARASGVRLAVDPVDAGIAVLAQEVELAQAVVNLVRNAIQGCDDGLVSLSGGRDGDMAWLKVSNRSSSDRQGGDGMGVGLLIARAIAEAHGGMLSRSRDRAVATAILTLPLAGESA